MPDKISPAVSPDNFHVSLASIFTGGSPIVSHAAVASPPVKDKNSSKRGDACDSFPPIPPPNVESAAASVTTEGKSEETSSPKSVSKDSSDESPKCRKKGKKCTNPRCRKNLKRDAEKSSTEDLGSSAAEKTDTSVQSQSGSTGDENYENSEPKKQGKEQKKSKPQETESSAMSETAAETTSADTTANDTTENEGNTSSAPESSAKTRADTTDADTNAKSSADESIWTVSEDCLLRALKEGGETWANIGAAMNRSKKELRARWNVIKDRPAEGTSEEESKPAETTDATEAESSAVQDEQESKDGKDTKQKKKDKTKDNPEKTCESEPKSESRDAKPKPKPESAAEKYKGKGKSAEKDNHGKGKGRGKAVRNAKVGTENKQVRARAAPQPDLLSGEEASSELSSPASSSAASSSSSVFFNYGPKEKRRQNKYLVKHVYSGLHPPSIEPEPDRYFSKEDCDILASVESKYTRSKWLEIQANFFNVTGKMVPLAAIRDKCENAKRKEGTGLSQREMADRLDKVEKWMSRVAQEEELEDPES